MIGGDNPVSAAGDRNPRERYLPLAAKAPTSMPPMPAPTPAPAFIAGPRCRLSLELVVLCGVLARQASGTRSRRR